MADLAMGGNRSWMKAALKGARARILIASPLRDERVHAGYVATLMRMARAEGIDLVELEDGWRWQDDLCRVRARMVRKFLSESQASHIWWLDGDVEAEPSALLGMLGTGRPIVCTPYPRRGGVDFERARRAVPGLPAEAYAYRYAVVPLPDEEGGSPIQPDGCMHVARAPLGCSLMTRAALEKLVAFWGKPRTGRDFWENVASTWHKQEAKEALGEVLERAYQLGQLEPDLTFDDRENGLLSPTVGLFHLATVKGELLSEDYSFCERARGAGLDVALYLGPGSPAVHYGYHAYRGHLEAFGLQRVQPE
jgi:hypothetical protein